ncbi:MAG: lysophospholipid acyltransferase family protein [Planktomarina sp.]
MSVTWTEGGPAPDWPPFGWRDWLRILRRAIPLAFVTFGCLILLLLIRLIEAPIYGARRPITPYITQFVCRSAFKIMGIKHDIEGTPMADKGAAVANHATWLDIFTLNAEDRIYFVAKDDVASWPGIGWLARATGTLFVRRERAEAKRQNALFEERLRLGHRLLFFPEGTTSDGQRVLPFKPTLFQSFFADGVREDMHIQPISVCYCPSEGIDTRIYGWWDEMEFGEHLLRILSIKRQGRVLIKYLPPVAVADFKDRKELAVYLEETIRAALKSSK